MFEGCTSLTQTPELPAKNMADGCYGGMISESQSVTPAPKLPATTLTKDCYAGMFAECTSLTQAPELPATTLAEKCYYGMFSGCSNLAYIKVAFTDWGTGTDFWLMGVAENGTFVCHKDLQKEYREYFIPEGCKVVNEDTSK